MVTHTLIVLGIVSLLEWCIWLPPIWHTVRKPLACLVIVAVAATSGWLVGFYGSGWTGLILIASLYRAINLLRIVEGRNAVDHMASVTLRTSLLLIGSQLAILCLAFLDHHTHVRPSSLVDGLWGLGLGMAALLLITTTRHLRSSQAPSVTKQLTEHELPTVTVAIPARNETDDLQACLTSLVASIYPKLEILVLDDCSQNKRTPGIIKDFAQAGVRFVAGKEPPEHWLAKNYAYQQLVEEASGDILLFCGVDTRFEPHSVRLLIETLRTQNKTMLSVLPYNTVPPELNPEVAIIQPARYAWELALPRELLKRPPVLSTCWLIEASLLQASGSFKAVMNSISVESYFARAATRTGNGYSFLRSGEIVGLTSHKAITEQRATALRTRYPQTHRRPEIVAALSLLEAAFLILPYVLLIGALFQADWLKAGCGAITVSLLTIFYSVMVRITFGRFLWRSLWLLPFAALYDIGILNYSMWRYEFREVIWKDRNVCIPLMSYGAPAAGS